jgi:DNA-binding LacI/PurR family transcriptional regulator
MLARVTFKDIARRTGVLPATVSLVFRNNPLAAKSTRARVQPSLDSAAASLRARYQRRPICC